MIPDYFYPITVALCLAAVIAVYFGNNPLRHGGWFMTRRFINWFPLGMTYAFLCMGRYNLNVAQGALGPLMPNQDFGIIFAAGTWTYALSFLVNGPLIDKKIGGKNGMLIAALGSALANVALGVLTWLIIAKHLKVSIVLSLFPDLFHQHVFSELRRDVHHQGQGLLVSRPRARRVRRDFRDVHFRWRLFRVRLERVNCRDDKGNRAG